MKRFLLITAALCLMVSYGTADETLLVSFEDIDFATTVDGGDDITLATSLDHTEGTYSLDVTYDYVAAGAWYYNAYIDKEFTTPVDVSGMEYLSYDSNVPTGNSAFLQILFLVDEMGYVARLVNWGGLDSSTGGWETQTFNLDQLEKNVWYGQGRAINMKKISKIRISIQRQAATSSTGTFTFLLDNMKFLSNLGGLQEVVLEDFESYADDSALSTAWPTVFQSPTTTLETSAPYSGSQSLNLSADISEKWKNYAVKYDFSSPQDFSTAKYFKVAVHGDVQLATLTPTAHLYLVDADGNRALAYIWDWPGSDEWTQIILPFETGGVFGFLDDSWTLEGDPYTPGYSCWREDQWDGGAWDEDTDLSQISSVYLSIETQVGDAVDYPRSVTIGFDDISVGYAMPNPPQPSVNAYNVNVVPATGTTPVIDGTVGAGEWALAESPGCTGFVLHNNNTTAASEDPVVKALFNERFLYILWEVPNADFALAFDPTGQTRDPSGVSFSGDDFEMFIAPGGNVADEYYQIVLFPDEAESYCYVWDAYMAGGPTSWDAVDQAAFSYNSSTNTLTIEYRVRFDAFNMAGAAVTTAPSDGDEWGMQLGVINNNPAEAVNWEPDGTAGFAAGRPYGTWTFVGTVTSPETTGLSSWDNYR